MDDRRRAGELRRLAQERRLLTDALDQVDLRRPACRPMRTRSPGPEIRRRCRDRPRSGRRGRGRGAGANWRCAGSRGEGWCSPDEVRSRCQPGGLRRTGRGAAVFHVKQGLAGAPRRGRRSGRVGGRASTDQADAAAGFAFAPRRMWPTRRVSAAGVRPSIRPAWPTVRGRMARALPAPRSKDP